VGEVPWPNAIVGSESFKQMEFADQPEAHNELIQRFAGALLQRPRMGNLFGTYQLMRQQDLLYPVTLSSQSCHLSLQ
jgi:hypothetical protein